MSVSSANKLFEINRFIYWTTKNPSLGGAFVNALYKMSRQIEAVLLI